MLCAKSLELKWMHPLFKRPKFWTRDTHGMIRGSGVLLYRTAVCSSFTSAPSRVVFLIINSLLARVCSAIRAQYID